MQGRQLHLAVVYFALPYPAGHQHDDDPEDDSHDENTQHQTETKKARPIGLELGDAPVQIGDAREIVGVLGSLLGRGIKQSGR